MTWRKWLVRGLVFAVVLGVIGLVSAYQVLTNSAATRRQVLDKLAAKFPGATVAVEAARLNLFAGIRVREVRLARRDDLDKSDFLYVPSGTIYHDKEHFLEGKVGLRKIVFEHPQLRILIDRHGHCNLQGLMAPVDPAERVPTLVFQDAVIAVEDHRLAVGKPILEVRNLNLTIVNDPLPVLSIEGKGVADVLGPVHLSATVQRVGGALTANVELPAVAVGPALVQRLACCHPETADHLRQLKASARVQAAIAWQPQAVPPLGLDLACQVSDGWLNHARLPYPLEHIEGSLRCVNDPLPSAGADAASDPSAARCPLNLRLPSVHLTAAAGAARLEMSVQDLVPSRPECARAAYPAPTCPVSREPAGLPASSQPDDEWPVREWSWKVEHLPVTPDLFKYLPEGLKDLKDEYKPCGPITVSYVYQRPAPSKWTKRYTAKPEGMDAEFFRFPYMISDITGAIERTTSSERCNRMTLNLSGKGGERPVTVTGTIDGEKLTSGVDLKISAGSVPMDDRLMRALPGTSRLLASQFHPEGLTDITALIHRTRGTTEFDNRYLINVHHAALQYDLFPYRLDQVTGLLEVHADHWECKNFRGIHEGGEVAVNGRSFPPTAEQLKNGVTGPGRIRLMIQGKNVQADKQLEEALAPPNVSNRTALQRTWRTLSPSGKMSFAAEVVDVPSQPKDIEVSVTMRGCHLKPRFFEYTLDDVVGAASYWHDQVDLGAIEARHGTTLLSLPAGMVRLRGDDGFYVDLPALRLGSLRADADLLAALPGPIKKGLASLSLKGPVDVATALIVDQKDSTKPAVIWWDGQVKLPRVSLTAGVEIQDIKGQVATVGRFDGQQMESMVGGLLFEEATVLGQPIRGLRGQVQVAPESPQTLRFRGLSANLYGGVLGGEAMVDLGPRFQYELLLKGLGIKLEELARHNLPGSSDVQGLARVDLFLKGHGSQLSDLKGNGSVDVPNGKLYRLPLLLDLVKALGLRLPDRTAFEQANMKFDVDSGKLHIQEVDLVGNAVSLRGQGTVNLDGSNVNLDFSAYWGRLGPVLPEMVYFIPQTISDQLLKIKMRGKIGDVRFEKELMPGVVEPFKKAFGSTSH